MLEKYNHKENKESPRQLAEIIIKKLSTEGAYKIPIDPFKLLKRFGVVYQFSDFDKLEGVYILPEDQNDIPMVGINKNRPIERQRFTAAHELCHHIKDQETQVCPIYGRHDPIEKYANEFAAELLMPYDIFLLEANKLIENNFVSFDSALKLSVIFGVSFSSCVFRLAYKFNLIEGETSSKKLKTRIRKYKPQLKKEELDMSLFDNSLLAQIVDSYTSFFEHKDSIIWIKFKNDYIFNEGRLEGIKLEYREVAEIITDLRLHKQESHYCKDHFIDVIETAGQSELFDFISNTREIPDIFSIRKLHKLLYQYAPFPEASGDFRKAEAQISKSQLETVSHSQIYGEVWNLDEDVKYLIDNKDTLSISEYMERAIMIHYRLTVIHPFPDGNGRVSRTLLN